MARGRVRRGMGRMCLMDDERRGMGAGYARDGAAKDRQQQRGHGQHCHQGHCPAGTAWAGPSRRPHPHPSLLGRWVVSSRGPPGGGARGSPRSRTMPRRMALLAARAAGIATGTSSGAKRQPWDAGPGAKRRSPSARRESHCVRLRYARGCRRKSESGVSFPRPLSVAPGRAANTPARDLPGSHSNLYYRHSRVECQGTANGRANRHQGNTVICPAGTVICLAGQSCARWTDVLHYVHGLPSAARRRPMARQGLRDRTCATGLARHALRNKTCARRSR